MPGVLADRGAEADAVQVVGARDVTAVEQPHFVEDMGVGQFVLAHRGDDLPALQDEIGVVEVVILQQRAADADCGTRGAGLGQFAHMRHGVQREGVAHDEVLRLVAGDEHLRQGDHLRPGGRSLRMGLLRLGDIAREIAYRGVQLGQCEAQFAAHPSSFASAPKPARIPAFYQKRYLCKVTGVKNIERQVASA